MPQLLQLNWLKWFTKRHQEEKTMKSLVITAMTHRKGDQASVDSPFVLLFWHFYSCCWGWFERLGGKAISSVCQISTSPPSFYFLYSSQTSAVKAAKCPKSALSKASSTCFILRLFASAAAADVLFGSECNGSDIWSALDYGNVYWSQHTACSG